MHNNAWYFRKGYRKMVKSPEPVDILEKDTIETMSLNGYVPMAVGVVAYLSLTIRMVITDLMV